MVSLGKGGEGRGGMSSLPAGQRPPDFGSLACCRALLKARNNLVDISYSVSAAVNFPNRAEMRWKGAAVHFSRHWEQRFASHGARRYSVDSVASSRIVSFLSLGPLSSFMVAILALWAEFRLSYHDGLWTAALSEDYLRSLQL